MFLILFNKFYDVPAAQANIYCFLRFSYIITTFISDKLHDKESSIYTLNSSLHM